jgi:hypothetical protein
LGGSRLPAKSISPIPNNLQNHLSARMEGARKCRHYGRFLNALAFHGVCFGDEFWSRICKFHNIYVFVTEDCKKLSLIRVIPILSRWIPVPTETPCSYHSFAG